MLLRASLALSLLAGTLSGAAAPAAQAPACTMAPADKAWLDRALAAWRLAERDYLKLDAQPLPAMLIADGQCSWSGGETGAAHQGLVRFPGGGEQPVGPISFAAPGEDGHPDYFAMTLPSVWRAARVDSPLGLERLMTGVLLHELMHTRQFALLNPRLAAIEAKHKLGDDLDDDAIQTRFGSDPAYAAAYAAERDALFAAAAAPTDAEARTWAAKALKLLRERRARWFKPGEPWAELDDIFLDMEGLGQWLAYRWLTAPSGAGLPQATVLPAVRRGGKYWTQDEGLALFLTIDRLVPDWQKLAFAPKPLLAEALLEQAAGG